MRLHELIPHILRRAAAQHDAIQQVQRCWGRLVGRGLARHAKPTSLRKGTLYIATDEPGASFTLNLEKPRLLRKLRTQTRGVVEEIVIRPGEV
ncbi:MAG: DUF721 domain-containing protein [Candidatus Omnitrophica bacterium]|nr:DUF721 domain-containing protein [Candidatus Omnitrophota bacterium]